MIVLIDSEVAATFWIFASAIFIIGFGCGWYYGYKSACLGHDWELPKVDWTQYTG
jgi:hypothetical protein